MRHLLFLTVALVPGLSHAATIQSFDVPGAFGTCGNAIASTGVVAGNTLVDDLAGTNARLSQVAGSKTRPFLYANGHLSYPHLNMPAGSVTFTGLNAKRFITASAFNGSATAPATMNFLYYRGAITTPSAGSLPVLGLYGITNRGVILGQSQTQPSGGSGFPRSFGFLLAEDGNVTIIDKGSSSLTPRGMDANAHHVVGTTISGAWVFAGGAFTPVTYPGSSFTIPTGVDKNGTISGSYIVIGSGTPPQSHGFFRRRGVYTTYDVPLAGVTATAINAMNEAGQITGCYTDPTGTHGFIAAP